KTNFPVFYVFCLNSLQTLLDSVHAGDSVSLNCSVLSDSDNKMCPGDVRVLWFRGQNSHPNIIYVDGKNQTECKKQSDTQKSCVYRFSKTVSSSDAGTYYCAVVTCGTILFGDGTKLQIGNTKVQMLMTYFFSTICLLISVIVNIVFTCFGRPRLTCNKFKGKCHSLSEM
uniref:Ig-like domain-containing protein n=1 Tax=Neolamprologus brichardi TaxID=32507 RepID=A0A3Q4H8F3_NEOBR